MLQIKSTLLNVRARLSLLNQQPPVEHEQLQQNRYTGMTMNSVEHVNDFIAELNTIVGDRPDQLLQYLYRI